MTVTKQGTWRLLHIGRSHRIKNGGIHCIRGCMFVCLYICNVHVFLSWVFCLFVSIFLCNTSSKGWWILLKLLQSYYVLLYHLSMFFLDIRVLFFLAPFCPDLCNYCWIFNLVFSSYRILCLRVFPLKSWRKFVKYTELYSTLCHKQQVNRKMRSCFPLSALRWK